jgi:hypothetical protein
LIKFKENCSELIGESINWRLEMGCGLRDHKYLNLELDLNFTAEDIVHKNCCDFENKKAGNFIPLNNSIKMIYF